MKEVQISIRPFISHAFLDAEALIYNKKICVVCFKYYNKGFKCRIKHENITS